MSKAVIGETVIENSKTKAKECDKENIIFNAFKFSCEQLSNSIRTLLNLSEINNNNFIDKIKDKNIQDKIDKLSKIYKDIVTVPRKNTIVKTKKEGSLNTLTNTLGESICNVCEEANKSRNKILLYLQGPVGCYKNILLQYVYLSEVAKLKTPMFYIDFSKFENSSNSIENDIGEIKTLLNNYSQLVSNDGEKSTPIFFLDNVRGFACNMKEVYNKFTEKIVEKFDCKVILSVDKDFNRIADRGRSNPEPDDLGFSSGFDNKISITALNLNRKDQSIEFIKNTISFFGEDKRVNRTLKINDKILRENKEWHYNNIYDLLVELELFTIDVYQLKKILSILEEKNEKNVNLSNIYDSWMSNIEISDGDKFNDGCYQYEYGDAESIDFGNKNWHKIMIHRSLLDFRIAKYFCGKLLQKPIADDLPEVMISKHVTRFIVPIIKNNTRFTIAAIDFVNNNKENSCRRYTMANLIYLLGRSTQAGDEKIQSISEDICKYLLRKNDDLNDNERLLLRTIYVNNIYQGNKDTLKEYTDLLLKTNSKHGTVNRCFHLDYYGDTKLSYTADNIVEYNDDVPERYLNTIRKLKSDIEKRLDCTDEKNKCILILQLLTYCDIVRVRKYKVYGTDNEDFVADLERYLLNILFYNKEKYSDYITNDCRQYLEAMHKGVLLTIIKANPKIDKYNKFSKLTTISRTGWINRGINDSKQMSGVRVESVAEHVYNCWLLGFIFLGDDAKDYDKATILNLLLLHDCGEVKVGDIVSIQKTEENKQQELESIKELLNADKKMRGVWFKETEDDQSNNNKIAREIDKIQAVYQFCTYVTENAFPHEKINKYLKEWLEEISNDNIETDIGKQIRDDIIYNNEIFLRNKLLLDGFCKKLSTEKTTAVIGNLLYIKK